MSFHIHNSSSQLNLSSQSFFDTFSKYLVYQGDPNVVFGLGSGSVRIWKESVKRVSLFGLWYIKGGMCEERSLKSMSDMTVVKQLLIFLKGLKWKFTNLPFVFKNIWIMKYDFFLDLS